ncbi:CoA pyrophosphatase [Arthrobacter sp. Helios]|uniref:NUDIX hydrolase n=1 Tax=Arthrobacter sp. Helios TaxID=2828862 RepID=UPI00204AE358|nr:CoA pyrophosphatase [Arthrobacter sp. Helios]UPO76033.1 CoA pyrophosphatase [Arthrobacter sp. Helios]
MSAQAQLEAFGALVTAGRASLSADLRFLTRAVDPAQARPAAVLILFGVLDEDPAGFHADAVPDDLDVLFVERAATLNAHPGQVAFPGGGVDEADADPVAAALREANEETGLDPAGVRVLGTLPQVGLPVSNFLVTPVLGWWDRPTPVDVVDEAESASVFRVPVADLLNPANRRTTVVARGGQEHRGPAFLVNGVVVWGFTALILDNLFNQLGWTLPWDSSQEMVPDF